MKKVHLIASALAFSLLYLFLRPVAATEPIKIGVTLGLTGKYDEMSNMQMKGFRLWESDVNSRGGILGRKVQIVIYDDKSDQAVAKRLYEHLILKDRVNLVFGPYSSEITEAILPVTEKYAYPVLASGAAADRLWDKGYKYVFGVYTPASKYTLGFLEMLVAAGIDNIAVAYADDSFSTDLAAGTKKWAERFGRKVVLFNGFTKGTKNLEDIALKAKSAGAQALIVCGHFDEAVNMRLALKKIKWYPKALFASVGPAVQAYYDTLQKDADRTFSSSQWEHHGGALPSCCPDFHNLYHKTYNGHPIYHAAAAFAAGQILEAAVKKAESLDKRKIRDVLSAMDMTNIIGRYGVDRTGIQVKHFNLIIQWQNGEKQVVWPEKLRTAKPLFK